MQINKSTIVFFFKRELKCLIDGEKNYLHDLQFIIEFYLQEVYKLDSPRLIRDNKEFIFSNIEDIFAFHKV